MRALPVFLAMFAVALAAEPRAVVLRPVVNMFSKPTLEADVVSQAILGVTVKVVEERDGWLCVQTPDEYFGWAETSALRRLKEGESYAESGRVAMVESLAAHLYPVASVTRRAPKLTVPYESRLEIIEEPKDGSSRWLAVRLPDDARAWVQRGDITFNFTPLSIDELIALSKRFLGLPYTWGGTSSFGYDCSGFTQMLCRRGGTLIPRDAQPQAYWEMMEKVERTALKPGDLLYFGSSMERISHTGFYLGNGRFIHSTTNSRPVLQISRLSEKHWTKLFVAARRWKK